LVLAVSLAALLVHSTLSRAGNPDYILAVDDRLTTVAIRYLGNVGRCVALSDFAAALGVQARHDEQNALVTIIGDSGQEPLQIRADWGVQTAEGLCMPVGFLCLKLGYGAEVGPPDLRYLRVKTQRNRTSREEFLRKHGSYLASFRLLEAIQEKQARCGVLAVNGRLLPDAFTILVAERRFVPIRETVEALGGRTEATSPTMGLRVQGRAGELTIEEKARWLRHRRFAFHTLRPVIEHAGRKYVEAGALARLFEAKTDWVEEYSAVHLVNEEGVGSSQALFTPGT